MKRWFIIKLSNDEYKLRWYRSYLLFLFKFKRRSASEITELQHRRAENSGCESPFYRKPHSIIDDEGRLMIGIGFMNTKEVRSVLMIVDGVEVKL